MKKQILDSKNRQLVMAALLITILGAGCAKTREASFPEGAGENVFEAALFTKGDVGVVTAAEEQSLDKPSRILRPGQQASKVHVREARAPEALRPMFKGLDIAGRGEKSYSIRFKLDRQFVTAFRVVEDPAELSEQDLELVQVGSVGEKLLPIFQYRIQGYGRVVRSRNDLGEETSTLRLKPTEWKDATHVQVSTLPEDRILVAAPAESRPSASLFARSSTGRSFRRESLSPSSTFVSRAAPASMRSSTEASFSSRKLSRWKMLPSPLRSASRSPHRIVECPPPGTSRVAARICGRRFPFRTAFRFRVTGFP